MRKYTITIESDYPPNVLVGQKAFDGEVVEIKLEKVLLVSASELAKQYSLTAETIRKTLSEINQGSKGKFLYNPTDAHNILNKKQNKRGRM